jgi:putative transposase
LWNKALALNIERLTNKNKILWYHELCFWTTIWKQSEEYVFLKECPANALQQKIMDLDKAFKDAFDKKQPKKRLPNFKKKGQRDSFRYPSAFKIDNNRVYLPKIGWVKFFKSREIIGKPKNITVSYKAGHWYIAIQTEMEIENPVHPSDSIVGVDLGISRFATLSDGKIFDAKNVFRKYEKKLGQTQRSLSRKAKFSNNWKKQRVKISKVHTKISNIRHDYLHWISTHISKNHAIIVLEDLNISNMSSSAKGSLEKPGKNVKAKSGLNKSILDQGWYEFRRQLEYKQLWRGGKVIAINPRHTSQTCYICNHVCKENRSTQNQFKCAVCGYEEHADLNAARNVLRAGHAQIACGDIKHVA